MRLEQLARARVRRLLQCGDGGDGGEGGGGEGPLRGFFGLGDARSLAAYQEFCGVNFQRQTLAEKALNGGRQPQDFAAAAKGAPPSKAAQQVFAMLGIPGL